MLPKLGNSNLSEQTLALQQVLPLLKEYRVIVLGDREFCSVDLESWLKTMGVSFCLRLKKNHCLETEKLLWQRLDQLGVVPGTSLYFPGVRVKKTNPVAGFNIVCKWKRNYQGFKPTFCTLNCHIRFQTPIFIYFYAGEATELRKNSIPHKGAA